MSRSKIKWNSERLLGISAMVISFITLMIFIYQTNLMSRQNYLSIMPYLAVSITNNRGDHTFALELKNHGVGPAIIESVVLEYQRKKYDVADFNYELYGVLKSMVPELDSIKQVSSATLEKGMAIPANSAYTVIRVNEFMEDYELMAGSLNQLLQDGLDYEIIYRSIQDERWRIRPDSGGPEKLR